MNIHRKTRKDIISLTDEDIFNTLCIYDKKLKRLTASNYYLVNAVRHSSFNSSKEFIKEFKKLKPNTREKLTKYYGLNEEEKKKLYDNNKKRISKILETKVKDGGHKRFSRWCTEYWIKKGYTKAESEVKISEIQLENSSKVSSEARINSSPRRKEYWIKKGFSEIDATKEVSLYQSKTSPRCIEYWIERGHTIEESKKLVSELQRENSFRYINNVSLEERRKNNHLCEEYWIQKGYTEEEIIKIKRSNGCTFSLEKQIKKFGEEIGLERYGLIVNKNGAHGTL